MAGVDSYALKLSDIVSECERIYGLADKNEMGVEINKLDASDVVQIIGQKIGGMSPEEVYAKNVEVGKQIVMLTYLSARIKFYSKIKFNFAEYPFLDKVANCLLQFTSKKSITQDSLRECNKIIYTLNQIDLRLVNHKFGLGYRYLRLFILLVMYGSYCNAGIVADTILQQFYVNMTS